MISTHTSWLVTGVLLLTIPVAASAQTFRGAIPEEAPVLPPPREVTPPQDHPIGGLHLPTTAAIAPHSAIVDGTFNYVGDAPEHAITGEHVGWRGWVAQKHDHTCDYLGECWELVCEDYKHYYSCQNLGLVALSVGASAPLSNTDADQNFRLWYQQNVRSQTSDDLASVAKQFGEYRYAVPAYLVFMLAGKCVDCPTGSVVHDWSNRSLRALIVGAPPVGVMQYAIGAGRPTEGGSAWRPLYDNNAVSGHAFVGSIPFLTAAAMTDRPVCRCTLILLSTFPAWSRVNDDAHYLSQACLGWCMGCVAVLSVSETEWNKGNVQVFPASPTGGPGLGVLVQY